jgi:superfamily II DNA or RNA helicase
MTRIFDNINDYLLKVLQESLKLSNRADFSVGYFNLRGWQNLDSFMEHYHGGEDNCCRLLIGMQRYPREELRRLYPMKIEKELPISNKDIDHFKKNIAREFRDQLMIGYPNNTDEQALQRLKKQLLTKKLVVKLHLRDPLHAKLYLIPQNHFNLPVISFVGSSNLTFSGLLKQGELNVDVQDNDANQKLQNWFDDRWNDRLSIDISQELAAIIDESWARETLIPPYYIYLKMAYHLSQEARDGLSEYQVPADLKLLNFQESAVRIAAHHVNKRGGVIVGDVVGLGKTLVGTAIARICEEDLGVSTLIICPKNLVKMWENYRDRYGLKARVVSISQVVKILPEIPARFRLVLIDESHNLRNRDGQRYAAIKDYINSTNSKCILLTATPYNKTYLDLSSQLRLFIPDDQDLGIKPEALIRKFGSESNFIKQYGQIAVRSLAAFEKSEFSEDWQQLMSKFMVRRTRSFIKDNYAKFDPVNGRKYLEFADQTRSYFPDRIPKTATFSMSNSEHDLYGRLYADSVVQILNSLNLPRYGLGNYIIAQLSKITEEEKRILTGLGRAGKRLMGFSRTNLFKRLESSGKAFMQSLERHILRNYVYLYALENNLEIPIGTQDIDLLDLSDGDDFLVNENDDEQNIVNIEEQQADYQQKAGKIYQTYKNQYQNRFKWIKSSFFKPELQADLIADNQQLMTILNLCGNWNFQQDQKLLRLLALCQEYAQEKILIFTQFADTARYLGTALQAYNIPQLATVTGDSTDPTAIAWRFSPRSNQKTITPDEEIRILISTDVLSEGQNLQDCRIIVNYDLPWAIIRLIQRAGRVDRIGQQAEKIICYSFLPADGVEQLINLRGRLKQRLKENAEVVGTDETFFEDSSDQTIIDLYHEKSGILDEVEEGEVDLISEAFQIWQNAIDADPSLQKIIENLPNVVYSTREHQGDENNPQGVLMYVRTEEGTDALAYIDKHGQSVTQSQMRILKMARCGRDTPAIEKHLQHHELVNAGSEVIMKQQKSGGGQLKGASLKAYPRLKAYIEKIEKTQPILTSDHNWPILLKAVEEIYKYPLKESAIAKFNRQFRIGISDEQLAEMAIALYRDRGLSVLNPEEELKEARVICSLGLFGAGE